MIDDPSTVLLSREENELPFVIKEDGILEEDRAFRIFPSILRRAVLISFSDRRMD